MNYKLGFYIVLSVLVCLVAFNAYSLNIYYDEIDKTGDCYYNFCSEYEHAYYEAGVCTCAGYDEYGNEVFGKEKYMN